MNCTQCQSPLPEGAKECPACGAKVPPASDGPVVYRAAKAAAPAQKPAQRDESEKKQKKEIEPLRLYGIWLVALSVMMVVLHITDGGFSTFLYAVGNFFKGTTPFSTRLFHLLAGPLQLILWMTGAVLLCAAGVLLAMGNKEVGLAKTGLLFWCGGLILFVAEQVRFFLNVAAYAADSSVFWIVAKDLFLRTLLRPWLWLAVLFVATFVFYRLARKAQKKEEESTGKVPEQPAEGSGP